MLDISSKYTDIEVVGTFKDKLNVLWTVRCNIQPRRSTCREKSLALTGLNLRRAFSCCINQLLISLRILITFHLI